MSANNAGVNGWEFPAGACCFPAGAGLFPGLGPALLPGWSPLPLRYPATWEFTRGTLFSARPRSLMAAILVPALGNRTLVTLSSSAPGIRRSQPVWNNMKPGIDGV